MATLLSVKLYLRQPFQPGLFQAPQKHSQGSFPSRGSKQETLFLRTYHKNERKGFNKFLLHRGRRRLLEKERRLDQTGGVGRAGSGSLQGAADLLRRRRTYGVRWEKVALRAGGVRHPGVCRSLSSSSFSRWRGIGSGQRRGADL